jgi:glycosyltransferase involved in cell wall biosynthesis
MTIPSIAQYAPPVTKFVSLSPPATPLFSIITVIKNNAPQLAGTIDSVMAQTNGDFELIIIDGDSADDWQSVVDSYEDPRIFCYSEPDLGIYDAMNKGIGHAKGQIIGTLNAGDCYQINTLKLVACAFHQAAGGSASPENCQEMAIAGDIASLTKNGFYHRQFAKAGPGNLYSHMHQPALFVTKSVYQRLGLFDTGYQIAGDYDFFLRMHGQVEIQFLGQILTRTSPAGVSGNFYGATLEAYRARVDRYPRLVNWAITGIKLLRIFLHLSLDRLRAWQFFERLRQRLQASQLHSGDK